MSNAWQPISSAPEDENIYVWSPVDGYICDVVGQKTADNNLWDGWVWRGKEGPPRWKPTHWRPREEVLPPTPEELAALKETTMNTHDPRGEFDPLEFTKPPLTKEEIVERQVGEHPYLSLSGTRRQARPCVDNNKSGRREVTDEQIGAILELTCSKNVYKEEPKEEWMGVPYLVGTTECLGKKIRAILTKGDER